MKRKVLGGLLSLILMVSALVGAPTALADSEDGIVRIKLSIGTPTSMPFFIDGNYTLAEDETLSLPRQLYSVKLEGGSLRLYYDDSLLYSGTTITLIQRAPSEDTARFPNNFIYLKNDLYGHRAYLGDLHFSIYDGYIRLINHIYIDQYLYGVVPHEMSNSWPREALKAQALAARNYALRSMNSGSYDLIDTSQNQVYKGFDPANTNAIAAVDETAAKVLMCDGALVAIYYSASNGGQVDIPQHRWSATAKVMPYHVIQDDPYDTANPYSSQELLIFPKEVSAQDPILYQSSNNGSMVTGTGPNAANAERYLKLSCLPAVAAEGYLANVSSDVEIVGINSLSPHTHEGQHGGVPGVYNGNDYTPPGEEPNNPCICFELADVTMTVMASRYAQGSTGVMLGDANGDGQISITDYTLIRLHILDLNALEGDALAAADVNGDGQVSITDYTMVRLHILDLNPIDNPPQEGELVTEPVTVEFTIDMHEFDTDGGTFEAFTRSLGLFVVEETDTSWNLYHRRYGHGLGMSQRGAQTRAQDGQTGEQIMQFYYPNTTIETLGITPPVLAAIAPAPDASNAMVGDSSYVNVRSSPDSSSDTNILGRLPSGARIEVVEANASPGWHKVNYGGTIAYMYASLIVLDD